MKVTILNNAIWADTGGARTLYRFMDELSNRGYEVHYTSPDHGAKWTPGIWRGIIENPATFQRPAFTEFFKHMIRRRLARNSRGQNFRQYVNLTRHTQALLRNWSKSDVTIATENTTALAAYWLADRSVPMCHMMHFEEVMYGAQNELGRKYVRASYMLPLYLVPNSTWLQNIIRRAYRRETPVLTHAIDQEVFYPRGMPREKYVDKKEWIVVSFVDARRAWKGFADAAEGVKLARAHLAKRGINLRWRLYGAYPPDAGEVEFECVGRVTTAELSELNASADIGLMASWYESFPLPPLEAMACGTLPVTSRYGTEDYAFDGKNALVFLPRRPQEIARKLIEAVEEPDRTRQLVEAGLETVKAFTWERATDRLEDLILQAKAAHNSAPYKFFDDLNAGLFPEYMYDLFDRDGAIDFSLFPQISPKS